MARVLRVVRGQDADVAGSYVVARRARPGTDRGVGDPGGGVAQARRLWVPALFGADVSAGISRSDLADLRPVGGGGDLHLAGRAGAAGQDRKSTRSELQSLMRISYAVFCLKKKKN